MVGFFALDDDWVRVSAPRERRNDAVLALGLLQLSAFGMELARSAGGIRGSHAVWAEYAALAAMAAPIAVRRQRPLLVAAATSIAFFVAGITMPDIAAQFSVQVLYFFALFSAMAWARERRQALVVIGGVSTVAMPQRLLAGTAAWWEPVLSLLVTLAFAALAVMAGERLYRRSVMQTQRRLTIREAMRAGG